MKLVMLRTDQFCSHTHTAGRSIFLLIDSTGVGKWYHTLQPQTKAQTTISRQPHSPLPPPSPVVPIP